MRAIAARAEDTLATLALGGIMLLPLGEIVFRRIISTGIPGAAPFTLNLTLWVGLLGAAIAAREGKLLTLATGEFLPKGRIAEWAHVVGGFAGSAIAMMFAVGGIGLVLTERAAGDQIALGVPTWISTLAFPIGFTLIGVRLERLVAAAPEQQVVITDTTGHWANAWITQVARAGVMDPFENHTFQPHLAIRRGDLATAVRRIVTMIAASNPALRKRIAEQPKIADMPATHLVYPAASVAVSSGVMPLVEGRFEVGRPVTGAEAVAVIDRLQALSR